MYEHSRSSTFSPSRGIVSHLNFGHFNRCLVPSHCISDLHFPNVDNVECLLRCLFAICIPFFGDYLVIYFSLFNFGFFSYEFEELFIRFRYKSFIRYVIYKYFHSVACPFILLTVSLKKEVLNLNESSILN